MCLKTLIKYISIVNLLFLLNLSVSETTVTGDDALRRSRRQLLFPNSTLLQLTIGIGTPTLAEMINLNWGFQANFQLPWNRSQIPVDIFNANSGFQGDSRMDRDANTKGGRNERDGRYENDAGLYHFYKYVEESLDSFGHNGSACVLQTLCQIAADPLHSDDEEDIIHEIANFVLDPTNDDALGVTETDDRHRFVEAYHHGRRGNNCFGKYENCRLPLLDTFTKLYDMD